MTDQEVQELRDLADAVAFASMGFELRPGQRRAIEAVVAGRDTLAVMPTGSGKSAIYQVAGVLMEGTTVVVSPLVALQRDQVEAIGTQFGGAVQVNSLLSAEERRTALHEVGQGDVEFVFVAPEQLTNDETLERLVEAKPSLFVVDEAHCISDWGHDFRPDYLRLGAMVQALGHPRVLALTATAAPPVRAEIIDRLGMDDPFVVVSDFERPNIWLEVETHQDRAASTQALLDRAVRTPGTGLVYVATRDEAETLAADLVGRGRAAAAYHAGLKRDERENVHDRFSVGGLVVVATIAFGMGIDAPHVRFVLHADPPESIDAYYQEFGRAGRDGEPAEAALFHQREEASRRRFFAGVGDLPPAQVLEIAHAVRESAGPVPIESLSSRLGLPDTRLTVVLDRLARTGSVALEGDDVRWVAEDQSLAEVAHAALDDHDAYRRVERSRADMMTRYLETRACRWRTILGYFGQTTDEECGHCDNCVRAAARGPREPIDDRPFRLGSRVSHPKWGAGQVIAYEGDTVTILFDEVGYRTLAVGVVLERELLKPA